jgi:hypothetical protein
VPFLLSKLLLLPILTLLAVFTSILPHSAHQSVGLHHQAPKHQSIIIPAIVSEVFAHTNAVPFLLSKLLLPILTLLAVFTSILPHSAQQSVGLHHQAPKHQSIIIPAIVSEVFAHTNAVPFLLSKLLLLPILTLLAVFTSILPHSA